MRWLVLLAVMPLVTAAGIDNPEGAFETRLYLHLDGIQEIPLNPFPPAEWFTTTSALGGGNSMCLETPGQTLTDQQYHTWYAVVAPTPPAYEEGQMETFPQRGIQADMLLDAERGLDLVWFMRAEDAAVLPDVVLRGTLREGDQISVGQAAMNTGRIVAINETRPAVLSPTIDHPDVTAHDTGDSTVYEFRLHLPVISDPFIAQSQSFNLRIDVFVDEDVCGDEHAMPGAFKAFTSSDHRPTLDLAVHRPVAIERVEARLVEEGLALRATVAAPFGASDAVLDTRQAFIIPDATSLSLPDWGDSRIVDDRAFPRRATHYSVHQTWSYELDDAQGVYNITLEVASMSGAVARADMPLRVGDVVETCTMLHSGAPTCTTHDLDGKKTPMPMAGAIIALALARRLR